MNLNRITKSLFVVLSPFIIAACGGGGSATSSTTTPSNAVPSFTASSFTFSGIEDQATTHTVSATDSDGDSLTYSVSVNGSSGNASITDQGELTYTPSANFNGTDEITVKVSDGKGSATATVVMTVEAVNDAPMLGTSQVVVSSSGISTGQIVASDVDGDALTYSVVNAPAKGELTLDAQTGQFSYTPDALQGIDGSFRVKVSDGELSAEGDVALAPSFVSNQDKLSYYYASEQSHLKRAEGYLAQVNDDLTKGNLSISIAKGYVDAGFYQEGIKFIENNVYTADGEAEAYRTLASSFDAILQPELALQMREKSIAAFNFYLAEKGIQNVSAGDSSFLMGLVFDYLDAGQTDAAEALLTTIRIYADAVRGEEYTTVYGRFLNAFNSAAGERVLEYLNNPSDVRKQVAINAINNMLDIADKTGYQMGRGDYAGKPVFKVRALYTSWATEYFTMIDAEAEAKLALAKSLSLYLPVNYDENLVYEANPHAEALLNTYSYPLVSLAGSFSRYYPQLENLPLSQFPEGAWQRGSAMQYVHTYDVVNKVQSGVSVANALAPVEAYFREQDDLNDYLRMLVEYAEDEPRVARLLYLSGYKAEAQQVADAAVSLISSEEFVLNGYQVSISGSRGCYRFSQLYTAMELDTSALYAGCAGISETYYQGDRSDLATADVVEGNRHLLQTFLDAQQHELWPAIEQRLVKTVAMISDTNDRWDNELIVASALSSGAWKLAQAGQDAQANQAYSLAIQWMQGTLSEIDQRLIADDLTVNELDDIVSLFSSLVASNSGFVDTRYQLMQVGHAVRMGAGRYSNYATNLNTVNTALISTLKNIVNATQQQAENIQQGHMNDLVNFASSLRDYALAEQLLASEVNTDVDRLSLTGNMVEFIANQDDFPASPVATVDTDLDGLVNFFSHAASASSISESGLTADEDSDNDGTGDQDDLTPIGG